VDERQRQPGLAQVVCHHYGNLTVMQTEDS